jgi:hypothetical protein
MVLRENNRLARATDTPPAFIIKIRVGTLVRFLYESRGKHAFEMENGRCQWQQVVWDFRSRHHYIRNGCSTASRSTLTRDPTDYIKVPSGIRLALARNACLSVSHVDLCFRWSDRWSRRKSPPTVADEHKTRASNAGRLRLFLKELPDFVFKHVLLNGISTLHPVHHVAQKSSKTTLPW